jgi:alpha-amylase
VVSAGGCAQSFTVANGQVTLTIPAYGAVALRTGASGEPEPTHDTTTVFYSTAKGWSAYNIHYRIGAGSWTAVPGLAMSAACPGWVSREIETDGATITAAFNDNAGTWDNNGTHDYTLSGDAVVVSSTGAVSSGDPCTTSGAQGASFTVTASASSGQGVYVVGDITALGSWAPADAIALTPSGGSWSGTVALPVGTTFQYKYIKRDAAGSVVWETGANRTATVGAGGSVTLADSWRY